MSTISVVIITFNEEKNIEECIKRVLLFADEIIIIDSFSTDSTELICKKFDVKFIKRHFNNYSTQRNFAFELSKMDFIFFLDADEFVSGELVLSLLKLKNIGMEYDAYMISRYNNFCGKWINHGMWYPEKLVRIIRNGKGIWKGEIHEKLEVYGNTRKKLIEGDLQHYSYRNLESFINKMNNYTTVQVDSMMANNKKAPLYKLFINPIWAFTHGYFLKLGFLDGWEGYLIHKTIAYSTLIKYSKLRRLRHELKHIQTRNAE